MPTFKPMSRPKYTKSVSKSVFMPNFRPILITSCARFFFHASYVFLSSLFSYFHARFSCVVGGAVEAQLGLSALGGAHGRREGCEGGRLAWRWGGVGGVGGGDRSGGGRWK